MCNYDRPVVEQFGATWQVAQMQSAKWIAKCRTGHILGSRLHCSAFRTWENRLRSHYGFQLDTFYFHRSVRITPSIQTPQAARTTHRIQDMEGGLANTTKIKHRSLRVYKKMLAHRSMLYFLKALRDKKIMYKRGGNKWKMLRNVCPLRNKPCRQF